MSNKRQSLRAAHTLVVLAALNSGSIQALEPGKKLELFAKRTWQTDGGLPQNTVSDVLQTLDGYLWIGTEGGLVRFDGIDFETFDANRMPGLRSEEIRSLTQEPDGTLWIGTSTGLGRFKDGRLTWLTVADGLPSDAILSVRSQLANRNASQVWAVTSDGLAEISRVQGNQLAIRAFAVPERMPRLTGPITSAAEGQFWVGTTDGLKLFRDGIFEDVLRPAEISHGKVKALLTSREGELWVGSMSGVFACDGPDHLSKCRPMSTSARGESAALYEDRHACVWFGWGGTLGRRCRDGVADYRIIGSSALLAFTEDLEGDLWVGTEDQGLTVLRDQKFTTYSARDGLAGDLVQCVLESGDHIIWVGTSTGLTRWDASGKKRLTTKEGLVSDTIFSLAEDVKGNILVGTPDGLNIIGKSNTISSVTSADGLADDFVRSIYADRDGTVWIGSRHGLSHLIGGRITTYTQADGLGSDLVGALLRDHAGDLWIATFNGLSRMHAGKFDTYRTVDGLSSNVITTLDEDHDGDLWIGTQHNGLNVRTGSHIQEVPAGFGLPAAIFGVADDRQGNLWLASGTGIFRVNRAALKSALTHKQEPVTVSRYGTGDGMLVNQCTLGGHPGVLKGRDGSIWFSTVKGIAVLGSGTSLDRVAPPVVIQNTLVDDRAIAQGELSHIPPHHSRLAFSYAGLSLAAPQRVEYRYRLEPFDQSWIDAGTRRTAYYTNLPPGRYRFRVTARNVDGIWNQAGAFVDLKLQPQFHQTSWFYFSCGAIVIGLAYLLYRWRVREVESRFQAVLQERNRIAREIHDTLAQGFVGVSVQLEIVSRLLGSATDVARGHLDEARSQVRDCLREARASIWQLRSQTAQQEDFASRLSKAAERAVGNRSVKWTVDVHGTYRSLDNRMEDEFVRIGQEALINAVKHGEPRSVSIQLSFDAARVRLTVADDGSGFDYHENASLNGHFGLRGMRERAHQLGGELEVQSEAGKGTRVSVEAPLK